MRYLNNNSFWFLSIRRQRLRWRYWPIENCGKIKDNSIHSPTFAYIIVIVGLCLSSPFLSVSFDSSYCCWCWRCHHCHTAMIHSFCCTQHTTLYSILIKFGIHLLDPVWNGPPKTLSISAQSLLPPPHSLPAVVAAVNVNNDTHFSKCMAKLCATWFENFAHVFCKKRAYGLDPL